MKSLEYRCLRYVIPVLLLAILPVSESVAAPLSLNILQRVLPIRYKNGEGTAFVIEIESQEVRRQYLITAKHILANSIEKEAKVDIYINDTWTHLSMKLIRCASDEIDIIVLAPGQQLISGFPVKLGTDGMILSEDIYFLGFPFGLSSELNTKVSEKLGNAPIAFIKKGVLSASKSPTKTSPAHILYLDAHNNPGFSGGPVVIKRDAQPDPQIIGVISGYRPETHPVIANINGQAQKIADTLSNSGVVVAYSIQHAIEAINKNPIGPVVH
ncbi:MAG: serine protease [Bdellovibrionota bacterium]